MTEGAGQADVMKISSRPGTSGGIGQGDRPGTAMSVGGQCDGSDGMMSLVRAQLTGILEPFAENVEELHKMVFSLSENIRELSTQVEGHETKVSGQDKLLTGLRSDLDQARQQFGPMQALMEKTAGEAAAEAAELRSTSTKLQAISKQTLDKLDAVNALAQNSIKKLEDGLEGHSKELVNLTRLEGELKNGVQGNKENVDRLITALHSLNQEYNNTAETVKNNKLSFDQHLPKHEALVQVQKDQSVRFEAFREETSLTQNEFRESCGELDNKILKSQARIEQNREEAIKTHSDAVSMLKACLDGHDEKFEKTTQRFQQVDEKIGSVQDMIVQNGENTSKLIKISDEKRVADVIALRKDVEAIGVDSSRHSRQIVELQEIVWPRPPNESGKHHVQALLEEMKLSGRRHVRLEQMFGLEPLTAADEECDAGLVLKNGILLSNAQIEDFNKKFNEFDADGSGSISVDEVHEILRSLGHDVELEIVQFIVNDIDSDRSGAIVFDEFCSLMSKLLGPDGKVDVEGYLTQMSEAAKRESKQNQMAELLPVLKQSMEEHTDLIQQEQTKLTSATDRVQSLEGNHAALAVEVEKLRANLNSNNEYWKGLSQGLKETKRSVRGEGENGNSMVPSAKNLRNLPPLDLKSNTCSAASNGK